MKKLYLIMILALALRLISLNQSLWLDEATTALVAKDLSWTQLVEFAKADFHPPLYYAIVKVLTQLAANYSEVALRLPSVLAGVGTVFTVYKICKVSKDSHPLLAAALIATAPLHVYYSQEARMYVLAAFFVSLGVLFYLRKSYFAFSVLLIASLWTDYMAVLILPVFFVHSWFFDRPSFKKVVIAILGAVVACMPMWAFLSHQLTVGFSAQGSRWWNILGVTNVKNIALIPVKFIIGRISFSKALYVLVLLLSGTSVLCAAICSIRKSNKILYLWLFLPVILGAMIGLFVPIVTYFRFLFVIPSFYLLVSNGPRKIIYIILVMNLAFTGLYLFNAKFHREDWRSAVAIIESGSKEKSQVIFPADSQMEAYKYYSTKNNFSGPSGISASLDEIWLMRYVYDIVDPEDATRKEIEELGFEFVSDHNLNGVIVYKYENRN